MKNKLKKLLAATAIVSVFGAVTAVLVTRFKKNNEEKDAETEDLDLLDLASINNDTPREYVSISINGHEQEPETGSSQQN